MKRLRPLPLLLWLSPCGSVVGGADVGDGKNAGRDWVVRSGLCAPVSHTLSFLPLDHSGSGSGSDSDSSSEGEGEAALVGGHRRTAAMGPACLFCLSCLPPISSSHHCSSRCHRWPSDASSCGSSSRRSRWRSSASGKATPPRPRRRTAATARPSAGLLQLSMYSTTHNNNNKRPRLPFQLQTGGVYVVVWRGACGVPCQQQKVWGVCVCDVGQRSPQIAQKKKVIKTRAQAAH